MAFILLLGCSDNSICLLPAFHLVFFYWGTEGWRGPWDFGRWVPNATAFCGASRCRPCRCVTSQDICVLLQHHKASIPSRCFWTVSIHHLRDSESGDHPTSRLPGFWSSNTGPRSEVFCPEAPTNLSERILNNIISKVLWFVAAAWILIVSNK